MSQYCNTKSNTKFFSSSPFLLLLVMRVELLTQEAESIEKQEWQLAGQTAKSGKVAGCLTAEKEGAEEFPKMARLG